jgi:hypothetical protein
MEAIKKASASLKSPRVLKIPDGPELFDPKFNGSKINLIWRGSSGAANYSILNSDTNEIILDGILDNKLPSQPIATIDHSLFAKIQNITIKIRAFGDWGLVDSNEKRLQPL